MASDPTQRPTDDACGTTVAERAPARGPMEALGEDYAGGARLSSAPRFFRHPIAALVWTSRALFGAVSLVVLLAVLAAIPIVNFLVLGFLLEAEGRVARSGRLRSAFPLLPIAPRLGSFVLGTWLWLLPLRLLANAAADARLIDPSGAAARHLNQIKIAAAAMIAIHLCLALARGGSLSCFFRPIKNVRWFIRRLNEGGYFDRAAAETRAFVAALRLRQHFSIGVRGFVGALAWLFLPTALFAAGRQEGGLPAIVAIVGGMLLVPVLCWMPFLQARFAREDRLRSIFELRATRRLFRRAPCAWLIATVVVYVLALPLYLLKIVLLPQDALWLVTLVFIASIYPARIVTGWAYGRSLRRTADAWFGYRWLCRGAIVPLVSLYVFILFFTQFIDEHGKKVLFEHHAFLLPVPF